MDPKSKLTPQQKHQAIAFLSCMYIDLIADAFSRETSSPDGQRFLVAVLAFARTSTILARGDSIEIDIVGEFRENLTAVKALVAEWETLEEQVKETVAALGALGEGDVLN